MKISKRHPIILPDFNWSGEEYDWSSEPVLASRASELPIAYLVSQLESMEFEIVYVGLQANRLTFPLRRPNIFVMEGDIDYPDFTQEPYLSRVDALGLIICKGTWLSIYNEDASDFLFFNQGIPKRFLLEGEMEAPTEGWYPFALNEYAGGRLLMIQSMHRPFELDSDSTYTYTAGIGSEEFCLAAGTLGAGTDTVEDTIDTGLAQTASVSLYYEAATRANLETVQQHVDENFDKFFCYYRKGNPEPLTVEIELGVSCFIGGEEGANGVTYGDTGIFMTFDNQAEVTANDEGETTVGTWLNPDTHTLIEYDDLPDYDTILRFFEED